MTSFVQVKTGSWGTLQTSVNAVFTSGVTAGNLVVIAIVSQDVTQALTVTDSSSDTATDSGLGNKNDSNLNNTAVIGFFAPTAGVTTFTIHIGSTGSNVGTWYLYEISGLSSASFDKVVEATGTGTAASSGATATLTNSNDAAIQFFASYDTITSTTSGFTDDGFINPGDGGHKVLSSNAALTTTATIASSTQWIAWAVTIKGTAAGAAAPFHQSDWSLPQFVESYPYRSFEWGGNRKLLIGQDKLPFRQTDWPLPGNPEPDPRRSWEWGENRKLLIGQDKLPFRQRDWPLPASPEPDPRRSWEWDNRKILLGQDALPFRQRDWPLPNPGFSDPDFRRSWTWSYNLNLIGQDQLPFRQRDWSLPVAAEPDWRRSWTLSLLQTTLTPIVVIPFRQTDWPLPMAAEPDPRRSWTWSFPLTLIGQDHLPFRQIDWPLPQAPPLLKTDQLPNFLPLTVVVAMPFRQTDWPLPIATEPDPRRSWTWSFNLNLIGHDALPFRQFSWPLPDTPDPWRMGPVLPNLTLILPTPPPPPPTTAVYANYIIGGMGTMTSIPGNPPS